LSQLNVIHAAVIGLTATFLLLAFDRAGELRNDQYVYVPPAPKVAAVAPAAVDPDKGKPPPHNDKVEDLPEGKNRELTFYTCTACHGVTLIKAQGLTRELWDSTIDLMLEKHRMPPIKAAERAEIVDYLAEHFPPRRKGRGNDNPFLK
jgi:mono/diheme cytochrome c family protein